MRKKYPYLQDSYYEDANSATQRRKFLQTIDNFINQKQYVKITLLNWSEQPLKEIQGELTSGTLTKDGSSSVRRTCSLSASVDAGEYSLDNADMDFAINKKIFIEIGVENQSNQYLDYPILWFPQGVFFISTFSISTSTSSAVQISLQLKDKMCGLNGEVGGTFPATVIFDTQDTQDASGAYISEKVLVYNIIQELVHHYGGEDLNNIVIKDVPLRAKQVMKWTGSNPLWLKKEDTDSGYVWYTATIDSPISTKVENTESTTSESDSDAEVATVDIQEGSSSGYLQIQNGTDAGYIYRDLTYTGDLTANMGENVTTILDKIVSYLGNYEYFYDEFGIFHFQEITNYMNTTQAKVLLDDMSKNDYLVDTTTGKTVYAFSDKTNLISLNASPQYSNIKNDYIIQGKRSSTSSSISYDVRYHLAIDKKPECNTYYNVLLYKPASSSLINAIFPLMVESEDKLPQPGNFNLVYGIKNNWNSYTFKYWDDSAYKDVNAVAFYPATSEDIAIISDEGLLEASESATEAQETQACEIIYGGYQVKDWRTEIYMQGLMAKNNGTSAEEFYSTTDAATSTWQKTIFNNVSNQRIDVDFYYEELYAFWPQIYDMSKQQFLGFEDDSSLWTSSLTDGNYYLDFIDPSVSGLGQYSVANIGRRTDAVSSEDVNCLFAPEIPDIIFLNADEEDEETRQSELNECRTNGQPYTQVRGDLYYAFAIGGYKNSAFDQLKYELYLHTNYQQSLSLTARPAFYLEPNSRISVNDSTTNTYGDYVVQNISFSLGAGNSMSVSASECLERF
jgi:hypothetical protein